MRVLGLDLGGTKLLALAVDEHGAERMRERLPTGRGFGPELALDQIVDLASRARTALGTIDAIGIGFPGLVDHASGVVRATPMLDAWADVELAARVTERLGIACVVDNDVNVAAVYEQQLRGTADLLYIAIGTGIGGALVLDGALWRGAGFAGEVGHVCIERDGPACACGRRGCVGLYASGTALAAGATLDAAAGALAIAIGSVLNVVDVPLVVLGGGVVDREPKFVDAVATAVRGECFAAIAQHCTIEPARAGYDAGALGAALLAAGALDPSHRIQPRSAAIRSSSTT